MSISFVYLKIKNCKQCPFHDTQRTEGTGYAIDYICLKFNKKKIKGYVESSREEPQNNELPDWCPLFKEKNI